MKKPLFAALGCTMLLALPVMTIAAQAADPYLYDVIKQSTYRKAYDAMIKNGAHLPSWIGNIKRDGNYVATPATAATVDGIIYQLFHACKAHDCAGNELEIMFTPGATKAYGLVIDGNKPKRWLGNPSAAQQTALTQAVQ